MTERRSVTEDRLEVRCAACAGWIATVPAGTVWARARCIKRGCTMYGEGQTVVLENFVLK